MQKEKHSPEHENLLHILETSNIDCTTNKSLGMAWDNYSYAWVQHAKIVLAHTISTSI